MEMSASKVAVSSPVPFLEMVAEHILAVDDRVVVTGMGEMTLVGRRIAEALASTGTPTAFVGAAEAIEDDLTMIRQDDLVILVSDGGDAPELVRLAWLLARFSLTTIAIARPRSKLGRKCDIVLDIGASASPSAAIEVCDALAVSLMLRRGGRRDRTVPSIVGNTPARLSPQDASSAVSEAA
jgi:arabinose-5-phosphate isomerase